ncbi:hypothetical protein ATY81_24425 [Rhizobium sp. R72]|uniref:hypothetical protein n=1 Tax=unclassified Rhizobium TaxID=2613769 RepID=UPI000B68616D|nr:MULTISPECIES: hypothetical protein [unclassified Rhizobium]OWW01508.1 hypothetical protein ATY81_24425 [Rhizobium sp. R72]OWW01596.1 hypothetical protein ATY80_24425 [Rhizobium sp. R711]
MAYIDLGALVSRESVLSLVVGVLVGLLAYHVISKLMAARQRSDAAKSDIERRFRSVFAIMDEGRRQSLIRYHMEKYECGREDAMRRAVEERERDSNRW